MITVENLSAGYGGKEVLHNISFKLQSNESLCVIGPNGCGKTTLLRAIAGTLPFSGNVIFDGADVKSFKQKALAKKIAMLSQTSQMYFNYTVLETVIMGRYVHGSGGLFGGVSEKDKTVAVSAVETVGMLPFIHRTVDTLSGGQLQRVFLAKILAQDPDIILLDEPTNHLDLSYQIELIGFLKQWSKRDGKAVIGVLHDLNLAMLLSDKILLLDNGYKKAFGNNKDICISEELKDAYNMDIQGFMTESFRRWDFGNLCKTGVTL